MLHLKHCSIEWTDYGARVVFAGGKPVDAAPHDTHHYAVIAHRCGYGDDLMAYCREHELAHIVGCEFLFSAESEVLSALAHARPLSPGVAAAEEMLAMTVQRWVRANERPIIGGIDWDELKAVFLGYVAQLDADLHAQQAAAA